MARFGQALKPSKPSQQLSKASAPEASCWLCHGTSLLAPKAVSIGLRNCRVARFGQALKPSKPSQQLSKASASRSVLLALPWCLAIGPTTSIGLRNCLLRNLLRNLLVQPGLALHQSLPDLLWNLVRKTVEPDLALHQSLPEPSPEPSPEPYWTWLGFAPRRPGAFSGTFSGTLLNLSRLCTKASQDLPRNLPEPCPEPCLTWRGSTQKPLRPSPEPSEPSPEPRWTWPSACTSAHRSYSGLKTLLAYAVGEKLSCNCFSHFALTVLCIIVSPQKKLKKLEKKQKKLCLETLGENPPSSKTSGFV